MENVEFYWELVSHIESVLLMIVDSYLYIWFIKQHLGESRCARRAGITYFAVILILYLIPYHMWGITAYASGAIFIFMAMYLPDHTNRNQKIFLSVIIFLIHWFSRGIALIPRMLWFDLVLNRTFIAQHAVLQFVLYIVIEIIYITLNFLLMRLLFIMIEKAFGDKKEPLSNKELGLLLSTPLSVMLGYFICVFYSETYLQDMRQYIWNVHTEYDWVLVLYQVFSFAAILVSVRFYQSIRESLRKEKETMILSEQLEHTRRHIKEMERLYTNIRGMQHDMGNHMMILEKLLLKNESKEAENYLAHLREQLAESTPEIVSGNPVTDIILIEKQKEAREKGIAFQCCFHYPKSMGIDAFDLSVILVNALTNAIEGAAECEVPYVKLSSSRNRNVFMIEIENSFRKRLILNTESGLPETTKASKESHGFGLLNIRNIARKYWGDVDIDQDGQCFLLSVMLMAKQE